MFQKFNAFTISILTAALVSAPATAQETSNSLLPSVELENFLSAIPGESLEAGDEDRVIRLNTRRLPQDSFFGAAADDPGGLDQPFLSSLTLLVLLDPRLSPSEVATLLEEYNLRPIVNEQEGEQRNRLGSIGAVLVDASGAIEVESAGAAGAATIGAATQLSETAIARLAERLSSDPRIIQVTPDAIQSTYVLRSAVDPMPQGSMAAAAAPSSLNEETDWGAVDAKIIDAWPQLTDDIVVGVIDVGFADHEDLNTDPALPHQIPPHNHGNHVAGIMCALHNGMGVKGSLPNCTVKITAGSRDLQKFLPIEDSGIIGFYALFSELLATTLDFIENNASARTINLSLGYNWMPNFGIDPREPGNEQIRDLVRAQGRFFLSVLAYAKARDVALVAAAGNDSSSLPSPLPAMWASPFAFGSMMIENLDGWSNGVVVEAHDRHGRRASFSNVDGHLSCPGVDVYSTLASTADAYGRLSGTSMAAPYCAAALEALRVLRPSLSLRQAIDCLRESPRLIEGRVPALDLRDALDRCSG